MRHALTAVLLLLALASPAAAQLGVKTSDQRYGTAELTALLSDHAMEFFDGSVSRFRGDGAYSYKYTENDRPWLGTWQVAEDGQICVTFTDGASRCDRLVSDGTRLVLVIADGTRFPVRDHRALVEGY